MSKFARFLSGCISLLLLAANVIAAPADLDNSAEVEAFIDGLVRPLMKNNNSPSGTVAITKDGQLIFAKGYGHQDIEKQIPVNPYTTLFRPGSTSKLFTWVSVMQLVEQGKLDLDTDVNDYLNTFKIKETFERPVTLRDIMTHSAGFEDGGVGYLIVDDPARMLPLRDSMERYQPFRVNPPGAQTAYSNYGTALAGLIVSNISGLAFNDYIQQKIFDPLKMTNSSFVEPLPENLASNMATSYAVSGGKFSEKPFEIISSFGPAGSQSATSTDMVRFAQAILNGGELDGQRILKQETVDQMLTRNFSHDDRLMGMALGFYETDVNGIRVLGHGGDTQWFHSYLGIDKKNQMTFFVSFGAPGGGTVRSSFLPSLYNEFFPRNEAPPIPPEDFSQRADRYTGTYGFWRSNFSTFEKALGLSGGVKITATRDNTLVLGFAGKSKQYVEIEANLFREQNSGITLSPGISPRLLAFQENNKGDITGFVMDGVPFMSLRKLPLQARSDFNLTLLGISMLVFLMVLLRRFFQRTSFKSLSVADKSALRAATYVATANLVTILVGIIVLSIVVQDLFSEIPVLLKLWLALPIVATLAGLNIVYRVIVVWRQRLLSGILARIRFTFITACALWMCWFYYYWNILGYQYL